MIGAERQIVWLSSEATTFAAMCEACLADPEHPEDALSYRAAKVEGSLRIEADVGFTRCRRGHRLCVRRTGTALVAARSAVASP
ncbi:MAG: hypothetical protein H0U03_07700 [Actinobacteria bacterium]|nr:hypothetical protein [Actinomycetota bacterium]